MSTTFVLVALAIMVINIFSAAIASHVAMSKGLDPYRYKWFGPIGLIRALNAKPMPDGRREWEEPGHQGSGNFSGYP
jgi:hypothetical protein